LTSRVFLRGGEALRTGAAEDKKLSSSIIENAGEGTDDARERFIAAGGMEERTRRLDMKCPNGVYSLSHVALAFPLNDSL